MAIRGLEHWTDLASAGGAAVQDLRPVSSLRESLTLDGNDALSFELPRVKVSGGRIALRDVVRLTDALSSVREYRVRQILDKRETSSATVECAPVQTDLATGGIVIGPDGSSILNAALTATQWIDTYVLANLATDGLTHWGRGTVEFTALVTLSLENVTRLQLLRAIAEQLGAELDARRNGESGYLIDLVAKIGSGASTVRGLYGRNLLSATVQTDDSTLATVIQPYGTKPNTNAAEVSLRQMAWRINSITGAGPYVIALVDPDGGTAPIAFDDQFIGNRLIAKDATTYAIADSTASGSTVTVASLGTLAVGQQVGLQYDSNGVAIRDVPNPAAVIGSGRVVAPLAVPSARGERNLLGDGNFAYAGFGQWGSIESGYRELYPVADTANVSGTSSSGISASTSLPVAGFPANITLRRGERVVIAAGLQGTSNAAVAPTTTNTGTNATYNDATAAVSLSAGLASTLSDGASLATNYGPQSTVTVNGTNTSGATTLNLKALTGARKLINTDKLDVSRGGTYVGNLVGQTVVNALAFPADKQFTLLLNSALYGASLFPQTPDTCPDLHLFTVLDNVSGISRTVKLDGAYAPTGTSLSCLVTMTASESWTISPNSNVYLTNLGTGTVTLAGSTQAWPTNGNLTGTLSTSFAGITMPDGNVRAAGGECTWKNTSNAVIASLTIPSGLSSGATTVGLNNANVPVIPSGTTFSIAGADTEVNAQVTLNGAGAGTITLLNAITVGSGVVVQVPRNTAGWAVNSGSPLLARITGPMRSETIAVAVPSGLTVPLMAKCRLLIWSPTTTLNPAHTAVLGLYNAANTLLTSVSQTFTAVNLLAIELAVAHTLAATTSVYLRVNLPSGFPAKTYVMVAWEALYAYTADATIGFRAGSFANPLLQLSNVELTTRSVAPRTVTARVVDLSALVGVALPNTVLQKGGAIAFDDIDIIARMSQLDLDHLDPSQSQITLDTLPVRVTSLV